MVRADLTRPPINAAAMLPPPMNAIFMVDGSC